ncbi:MAG: VOC family protein [Solirubrobacteraceae bacterium]|nr:VOC family protein [Patulibacter sp.]
MTQTIRTFLMFEGRAEEAVRAYAELFDGEITKLERYGADGPGPEGTIFQATLRLGGQDVMVTDSFVEHGFSFTPSMSLWVDCVDAADVDAKAAALVEGGSFLMPPGDYGFSERFAWVSDRFGVTWQLSVASPGA